MNTPIRELEVSAAQFSTTSNRASNKQRRALSMLAVVVIGYSAASCSSTNIRTAHSAETSTVSTSFDAYPKLPDTPTSKAYRQFLKSIAYTRKNAFHGNYGGCGDAGGAPVDHMDELFRRHDILYNQAQTMHEMITADKKLIVALKEIDPRSLDETERAYRKRAINFFSSPASRVLGKPLTGWLRQPKSPESRLRSEQQFTDFMELPRNPREFRRMNNITMRMENDR